MICLGIESTAHTFGAALAEFPESGNIAFKILSDKKDVYKAPMGSGIHPREASRHHVETGANVVEMALCEAQVNVKDLEFISYSAGPGLGPCLRVGAVVARSLASYYSKPIIPTNHAVGHIELGRFLLGLNDPLVLLISGGHTLIAARRKEGWRVYGETLDLTLGQLLDQLGRHFGLSSPAGPRIEELAASNDCPEANLDLPYAIKGNDVSYSGLLSAAKDMASRGKPKEAVAYAVQEIAFSLLTEATERALSFTDKEELLVTGGVAANQRLSRMLKEMCDSRGVKFGAIPRQYAGDCGSQIAAAGYLFYKGGKAVAPSEAFIRQSWRIDRVELTRSN